MKIYGRDEIVKQAIRQRKLASRISSKLIKEVEAMQLEIATKISLSNPRNRQGLERLLVAIDELILGGYGKVAEETTESLVNMGVVQAEFGQRLATKMDLGARPINENWFKAVVVDDPFDGKILGEWITSQRVSLSMNLRRSIRVGIGSGKSTENIAKEIMSSAGPEFNMAKRHVNTMIRTAASNVVSKTDSETFKKAGVKKFQLSAVLDSRTTEICQNLDGKVIEGTDIGMMPPFHPNCRTVAIPLFGDEPEITETYADWIGRQDEATQLEALGRKRFEAYKKDGKAGAFSDD